MRQDGGGRAAHSARPGRRPSARSRATGRVSWGRGTPAARRAAAARAAAGLGLGRAGLGYMSGSPWGPGRGASTCDQYTTPLPPVQYRSSAGGYRSSASAGPPGGVGPTTGGAPCQVPLVVSRIGETGVRVSRGTRTARPRPACVFHASVFHAAWASYLRTSVVCYCSITLQHRPEQRPEVVSKNRTPSFPFRCSSPVKRESTNICFIQDELCPRSLNGCLVPLCVFGPPRMVVCPP